MIEPAPFFFFLHSAHKSNLSPAFLCLKKLQEEKGKEVDFLLTFSGQKVDQ